MGVWFLLCGDRSRGRSVSVLTVVGSGQGGWRETVNEKDQGGGTQRCVGRR